MTSQQPTEEDQLLQSVEAGEWQSVGSLTSEIQRYQRYAQAQLEEIAEVKVNIAKSELQQLQVIADQLETSVSKIVAQAIHQYLSPTKTTG